MELFADHEITNGEGAALREQGRVITRERLKIHSAKVAVLAKQLIEFGTVEGAEFGLLINEAAETF